MKKFLMLIVISLTLFLSGCSSPEKKDDYKGIIATEEMSYTLDTTNLKSVYKGKYTIEFENKSLEKLNTSNDEILSKLNTILNSSTIYKSLGRDGRGNSDIILLSFDENPNQNNIIFYDYGLVEVKIIDNVKTTYIVEIMDYKENDKDYEILINMDKATYDSFRGLFSL